MKLSLIKFLNRLLFKFGWKIQSNYQNNLSDLPSLLTHEEYIEFLDDLLEFKTILDIGSHKGWWTQKVQKVLPNADFTLIDAVEHDLVSIDIRRVRVINKLLSDREKQVVFFQSKETGDSYYKELSKNYSLLESITMTATTLDELSVSHHLEFPDLVKLDVQGSELDVIQGGLGFLANCKVIICEVPLFSYNYGAPNFQDYIEKLDSLNFKATNILEIQKFENRLIQIDVGFIRSDILEKYMS